jgi:succinyl-CoA synthetase alpha subunit/citrate synthase
MRAQTLGDLLRAGDRVAVSNITGREGREVSVASQRYCGNIVGGWALGKGGQQIEVPGREPIDVFSTVREMLEGLPQERLPNKILVYSPPPGVYGEVKEIVEHAARHVETIFIVTEHVSVEVAAKIGRLCGDAGIDVLGCNSLGVLNAHDGVRVGAVGGDDPAESLRPGSVAILSNSGNMVNTMASYLQSAGLGVSCGISTGKDVLILQPLKGLLELARNDESTKLVLAYVEPGGLYEAEAVRMLRETSFAKPVVVYVTGEIPGAGAAGLGHAGSVVESGETTAAAKKRLFDDYFDIEPFDPDTRYRKTDKLLASLRRGIRIKTLHHLPAAARLICGKLGIRRDFRPTNPLRLNPWFLNCRELTRELPYDLVLRPGRIPQPYRSQVSLMGAETFGAKPPRRNMRKASHASANNGRNTRIYGRSIEAEMEAGSFVSSVLLSWTGLRVEEWQAELVSKCLIASLSNGPGTISAQGTKLSASAGNDPNTAMIATLACLGDVHGGNGRRGLRYLLGVFRDTGLVDPWSAEHGLDIEGIAGAEADRFAAARSAAKEAGRDYARIPCLGHPVFRNDAVNYDPRERVIAHAIRRAPGHNVFLDFYHALARSIKAAGVARNVWAVNLDAAIASVVLGMCWVPLKEKQITVRRAEDIAFMIFALGRVAGANGEYLDHVDCGTPMDMRVPPEEYVVLTREAD